MAKKVFNTEDIQVIGFFEKTTGSHVKDCIIDDESAYFIVDNIGSALGKKGSKIKSIQRSMNKRIKVFEYSEKPLDQIKRMIPEAQTVKGENGKYTVNVPREHKAKIIGRNGENINKIRELLERNHDISKLIVA